MLSLRNLMIFKTIVETGSFTKAAQKLYITQSAVSHAVRELEDYAQTVLFDRLSRHVRLTANGKLLLEEAIPILNACDSLEQRISCLETMAPLVLVSSITIAAFWLPGLLQELKRQMPKTPVQVHVVSAAEAVKNLMAGNADLALVEGVQPQGMFIYRRFAEYSLKIVCAPGYLPDQRELSLDEFCNETLLLREVGSAIRDTLDSQLYLLGRTVYPSWTSVNSTALIEAAKAGLGITVLPDVLVRDSLSAGTLVSLETGKLHLKNDMFAVWHQNKFITPAMKALIACITSS